MWGPLKGLRSEDAPGYQETLPHIQPPIPWTLFTAQPPPPPHPMPDPDPDPTQWGKEDTSLSSRKAPLPTSMLR